MAESYFAGRENILTQLSKLVSDAKQGNGNVVMISGESGSGKSALIRKFVSGFDNDKTVVPVIIECTDKEGINPYSPFKNLLTELSAEFAADQKNDKGSLLTKIRDIFTEAGPDWIGMIPVVGGIAAAGVKTFAAFQKNFGKENQQTIQNESDIQLSFENTFRSFAEKKTLLVILDDLQWADSSSLAMLFSLSRSIRQKPFKIMLIGTYRPYDIETGQIRFTEKGENVKVRHPLADKLNEMRNYTKKEEHVPRADSWLTEIKIPNLQITDIQKYIDLKFPVNKFPTDFPQQLMNLTNGHPLFMVEIIDSLIQKGSIYIDQNRQYLLKIWEINELPKSVTGVITERIQRLDKELRKILDYASVSGELFSVQILEQILKIDELDLLDYLSELSKKHGLLTEGKHEQLKDLLLDLYKFTNSLVHKYIYENLEGARRRALHRRIAEIMKNVYGDQLEKLEDVKLQYQRHTQIGQGLIDGVTLQLTKNETAGEQTDENEITALINNEIEEARRNFSLFAIEECLLRINRALGFISQIKPSVLTGKLQCGAFLLQARAYHWRGAFKEALTASEKVLDLAKLHKLSDFEAKAYNQIGIEKLSLGSFDESVFFLEQACKIFEKLNYMAELAESLTNLGKTFREKGLPDLAIEKYETAIQITRNVNDTYQEALITRYQGTAFRHKAEYQKSEKVLQKSLGTFLNLDKKVDMAITYSELGLLATNKNLPDLAIEYFKKALDIDLAINDRVNMANHYNNMGIALELKGELEEAVRYYQKTIEIDQSMNYEVKTATTMNNIGLIRRAQERYEEALNWFNKALTINRFYNDKNGETFTLSNMGTHYYYLGDYTPALQCYLKSLDISLELNDKLGMADCYCNIGNIYDARENTKQAIEYYKKYLEIVMPLEDEQAKAIGCNNMGHACLKSDEPELAGKYFTMAYEHYSNYNDLGGIQQQRINLGNVYYRAENKKAALKWFKEALAYAKETKNTDQVCELYNKIGNVYYTHEDYSDAITFYNKALELNRKNGNEYYMALNLHNLGNCYKELAMYSDAAEYYLTAIDLYENESMEVNVADCKVNLADVYFKNEKYKKAYSQLKKAREIYETYNQDTTEVTEMLKVLIEIIRENEKGGKPGDSE